MSRIFLIGIVLGTSLAVAQSKPRPVSRPAHAAFNELWMARDKEIVGSVGNNDLICFPDLEADDRFLVVSTMMFDDREWELQYPEQGHDNTGKDLWTKPMPVEQWGMSDVTVWKDEQSDIQVSTLETVGWWRGSGYYTESSDKRLWHAGFHPIFSYKSKDDNAAITRDETGYIATTKFKNKNGGTTTWTLTVRLSTGRYTEEWETTDSQIPTTTGRCATAKSLIKTTATK
jgi:hypothetical protein